MTAKRMVGAGVVLMVGLTATLRGATIYVDASAGGVNTGTNWADAYLELTNALANANQHDDIWVAQGTYYPGTTRADSFTLDDQNLDLYGGFTNGMSSLGERNWTNYPTILDGDVQQNGTRTDNAYHVFVGSWNCTMDGFIIRNGYADSGNNNGGGIFLEWRNMRITNCRIEQNYAQSAGAGVYVFNNATTLENCELLDNECAGNGGGATFSGNNLSSVSNCLFAGNTASGRAGALDAFNSPVRIQDSTFVTNRASGKGGAIYHSQNSSTGIVENCTFLGNVAAGAEHGGGVYVSSCTPTYRGCTFVGNEAARGGGYYQVTSAPNIEDCRFTANLSPEGAGLFFYNCVGQVAGTVLCGNYSTTAGAGGGGAKVDSGGTITFQNCSFLGNAMEESTSDGGAMVISWSSVILTNCTFRGNHAPDDGGSIYTYASRPLVAENCIFWDNTAGTGNDWYLRGTSTGLVSYTDIEGGWNGSGIYLEGGNVTVDGGGNINANPLFTPAIAGTWSAHGAFDPDPFQTVLEDNTKAWTDGALAGRTVNPLTTQYRQFLVVTNSGSTVTVWGDCAALGSNGFAYAIQDVHLQSTHGRWTPLGWMTDGNVSPCIDAGNPTSPRALEPQRNGERINMGAYGNTGQASKSAPLGTLVTIR